MSHSLPVRPAQSLEPSRKTTQLQDLPHSFPAKCPAIATRVRPRLTAIAAKHGATLAVAKAVIEAGAVRFRPMLPTARAVIIGASVNLKDPIFQDLALSLMAGEVASLIISRFAVPVIYFMVVNKPTKTP